MSQIKIIFFDVDGTLIDMRKRHISDRTLGALKSLQANDYILCLATGRGPLALPRFEDLEFDAYLTFNGSYCFDKEQTLLSNPIPKTEIDRLVRNATNLQRPLSIASDKLMVANGKDQDLVDYFAFAHQEVVVSEDFERVVAVADDQCGHVAEDGVYHYCKAMGLI